MTSNVEARQEQEEIYILVTGANRYVDHQLTSRSALAPRTSRLSTDPPQRSRILHMLSPRR